MPSEGDTAAWSASSPCDPFVPASLPPPPAGPCLELGPRHYPLTPGQNLVGRSATADVRLDSASVSRRHARIDVSSSGAMIEDLGSRNGTLVGEERIRVPIEIHDGDAIRVGTVWLVYRAPRDGDLPDD